MDDSTNKKPVPPRDAMPGAERRRVGTVVHDDRGNASVRWRDAPADHERQVLEVLGGRTPLSIRNDDQSFDPYARRAPRESARGRRADLRKLSQWIKLMRELEERKRNDGES